MPTCNHITEELCITRVPKNMFQKKAFILSKCEFAGGNKNHSRAKLEHHSALFCIECELSNSSFICLLCGDIHCGRYDAGHAIDHYEQENHAVVMDCISFKIHCYDCDEEVTFDFEPALSDVVKSLRLLFDMKDPEEDEEEVETVAEKTATIEIKASSKQATNKKQKTRKGKFLGIKSGKVVPMTPQLAEIISTGKPRGLKNIGNTCFMNSVLQSFWFIEPFFSYMTSLPPIEDYYIPTPGEEKKPFLSDEMRNFCNALATRSPKNESFSPSLLRNVFIQHYDRFQGFHQHDAHEYMRLFLDQIHTEIKKCRGLSDLPEGSTIISQVFGGILQSKVQCMKCEKDSNKEDVMLDLSLDLVIRGNRIKLTDCLGTFFAREVLDRGEKYDCSKCKSKQNSSKQMFIKKLPQILCLHFKRFRDDGEKMDNLVEFPLDGLSLDNYMAEEIIEPPTFYELTSIVVHVGVAAGSGHYVAYVKRDSQWFYFNDAQVKLVDKPTILKQRAYILIYSRKSHSAPTPTPSTSHSLNLSESAA